MLPFGKAFGSCWFLTLRFIDLFGNEKDGMKRASGTERLVFYFFSFPFLRDR